MLGRVELSSDVTLTTPTTFTKVTGGEMLFHVEEEEMLVDLYAKVTFSTSAVARADFTLYVDGANVAGTNGLACMTPAVIADENTVVAARTVRLTKGSHSLELRAKVGSGNLTVKAGTIPCELVAERRSHPATLGHGVNSKTQLIQ